MKINMESKMGQYPYCLLSKDILSSSSYTNKNGQHPSLGLLIDPTNVVLDEKIETKDLNDNQWKFYKCDEIIKDHFQGLIMCDDFIAIFQ